MKRDVTKLISVFTCIGLAVCLFQNHQLRQEVRSLNQRIGREYDTLDHRIEQIYSNVDAMLERKESLMTSSEQIYETADIKSGTASGLFRVTPKVYEPERTTAKFVWIRTGKEVRRGFSPLH